MGETRDEQELNEGNMDGLVVIGSSAGGIEAVLTLVSSLPSDFPAAIVVAQHIDPHRPSRLDELLSNRTSLRVRTASAHEPLVPGTVYVVPADRDVELSDHHLGLREDGAGVPHPSIDRLMASAARSFADNLVGVVLSGTGTDGAAGAQAIKAYGGTVIVQNPKSARYPDMPAAVPPSAVDVVADLDEIGPLLVDLFSGDYALPPEREDELRSFLDHVREKSGLDFGAYKRPTIERRLQRRMVAVGTTNLATYREYVEQHQDEMHRLVASFLIKVTRFLRDPELYTHLREEVLPALIDEVEDGELRLWSAGCATGEEAYTLAMLVTDLLAERQTSPSVRIFATDVATDAVDFARQGVYPESAIVDMPEDMVERHFVRVNGVCEVRKNVRSMVVFGEHDLSRRAPFPRIDLVLCRNVLIYFTPELQRRSLQLFAFSLRAEGYLVLGKAESVGPLPDYFALDEPRLKVFRRVGAPVPIPIDRVFDTSTLRAPEPREKPRAPSRSPEMQIPQAPSPQAVLSQVAPILDTLSTGIVIVDRKYDIQAINLNARHLLGILGAGIGEDVVHGTVPVLATPVRTAIDTALQGEQSTGTHRIAQDVVDERGRDVTLTCTPVRAEGDDSVIDTVVLEVVDVTAHARNQRDLENERDEAREESGRLRDRAAAAIAEVRELRTASQGMAAEQGRLRSENEQLQVSSEEAQAAAEEIETLNEEQQATNEELETLNEELQAAVEELNTTNADLQARAIEQEALATSLASERAESEDERTRLDAILSNLGDAVLVVDADGNVMQTNTAWERMLGPVEGFAPEDESGHYLPSEALPLQRSLNGEEFMQEFTLPGSDGTRRWFEAHAQPVYLGEEGEPWGVVVVREITERSLRRMQERFLAVASHELRTPLTTLSGSLQLVARRMPDGADGDRLAKHVGRAREQLRRLEVLVAELTDVARLHGGNFQVDRAPVDVAKVIRKAVSSATEAAAGQELRADLPSSDPVMVDGDAYRLEQTLQNLVVNAFRHAKSSNGVDVRLRRDGAEAIVEIQDYGRGIPEETLPQIFSQFYHSSDPGHTGKGLGLGLFIAREIITAHDGTINARSIVGEGTTFEIRLPLSGNGESAPEAEETSTSDAGSSAESG